MTLVIQKPTGGKVVLSRIQQYPAVLGEPWGGGYFAGYISHTANGNPTHALIVAPKSTGESSALQWKTANTATANTTSVFDGVANTAAMVTAGISDHPAASFCVGLSIEGFTDWYLPSSAEADIAYFNLKPTTTTNLVTGTSGINSYAIPARSTVWSSSYPGITFVSAFAGGAEAFTATNYWTSSEATSSNGFRQSFSNGVANGNSTKTTTHTVRAFRRIAL